MSRQFHITAHAEIAASAVVSHRDHTDNQTSGAGFDGDSINMIDPLQSCERVPPRERLSMRGRHGGVIVEL